FLGFQWESLLLETGWIVLFAAPWRRAPGPTVRPEAPREALFALRFLLFRLMFASGVVKIASGDPTWRDLTALSYHYESQPLPTWIGWWAHQLPLWIQQLTTAGVFTIELALPWLLWSTGPPRRWAALTIAALQILIALTGNYGWFNFLALGLALTALADSELKRLLGSPRGTIAPSKARTWAARIGLAPAVAAGLLHCVALTGWMPVGDLGESLLGYTSYYGLSGGYGLFAVMTRGRSEVVVEGTMDGMEWKPYLFKYKPQDPSRRPGFVEPHMPRLDWQLWFAALGPPQASPWLRAFMVRLLQASPPVLSLLDGDPFGGKPPKAVRARIRPYRMTTPRELLGNGNWWSIGEAEPFGPELWSTPSSS
ncbi:MAG TPA: lipase maturation factor family protein, partial [Bdellovibrionota bacterium]|nr:lipase maturation factor family protein [Bdellovibrionota bacterium]